MMQAMRTRAQLTGAGLALTLSASMTLAGVCLEEVPDSDFTFIFTSVGPAPVNAGSSFASAEAAADEFGVGGLCTTRAQADVLSVAIADASNVYVSPEVLVGGSCYIYVVAISEALILESGVSTVTACASFDGALNAATVAVVEIEPTFGPLLVGTRMIAIAGSPDIPMELDPPANGVNYLATVRTQAESIVEATGTASEATGKSGAVIYISTSPIPVGACLLSEPDAMCVDVLTQELCEDIGGAFQGVGMACADIGSLAPHHDVTADWAGAVIRNGEYVDDHPLLSSDFCTEVGACCNLDGSCTDAVLPGECMAAGGQFEGAGVFCFDTTCVPVNDDCENATPIGEVVDLPFSTFNATIDGPLASCAFDGGPNVWYCYTPTYSGIVTIDTCSDTAFDTAVAVYPGCGTPVEDDEAFCGDGDLIDLCDGTSGPSVLTFQVVEGEPYKIQVAGWESFDVGVSDLTIDLVPFGACCLPDGSCDDQVNEETCLAMDGRYQGDGVQCGDIICPPAGACCDMMLGTCTLQFQDDCEAGAGIFQGDDTVCDPSPCPPAGACCFGDECDHLTEYGCAFQGGCYRGDFTSCGNISSGGVNLMIPEDGTTVSHTIAAPNIGTVDDMRVFVNIDQQDLSGLVVELERDGIIVALYDQNCDPDSDDMRARFVDDGTAIEDGCMTGSIGLDSPPGFSPVDSLANFDGLPIGGEWTLHVTYFNVAPCGELNRWRLIFPNVTDVECVDCNMNGEEDSCETEPLYDPTLTMASDTCIGTSGNGIDAGLVYTGDTTAATSDAFLFCGPFFSSFDEYWAYVPRSDGSAFIAVNDFGPEVFMVSVHTGCLATEGNMIACTANNLTGIYVDVVKGMPYVIRVAGLNQDRGAYELMLTGPAALLNEVDDNSNGTPDECECRADVNGDGTVDALDFIQAMNEQGNCILSPPGCPSDVNEDGTVDNLDLALIINNWGPCPFPQMMMAPAFQPRSFKGEAVGDELMDSGKRR
ncbi:MAG: hypothetical protein AAF432_12160 [Planctomycetota bacterium]